MSIDLPRYDHIELSSENNKYVYHIYFTMVLSKGKIVRRKQLAYNLRYRHFLKLLDFTPQEIKFLLDLSLDLKKGPIRRSRTTAPNGQKYCPYLRESLDPNSMCI